MSHFFSGIVVGLPILWIFGVHINDIARVLVPFLLILVVVKRQARRESFSESGLVRWILFAYMIVFVLFTASQPILEVYLGRHGIDFAIFSQVIDSVSRRGAPLSSLIGMEWRNFLSHHFTPFLYFPGVFGYLGIPSYINASVLHFMSVAFAGLALGLAAKRIFNFSTIFTLIVVAILFSNPTFRHGVLFGIHDEIYSLPFIGFAYLMFLKGRHRLSILMLLIASLTKESMFLVASAFGIMAIIDLRYYKKSQNNRNARENTSNTISAQILYVAIVMYGLIGFVSYVFLQPILVGKGFDHADKLATITELTQLDQLGAKVLFLVFIGVPFLGYPLWRRSSWHLLLPGLPLIGLVLVSRFEEMWKPLNYYGVVPTYVVAFASLITLGRSQKTKKAFPLPAYVAALLMAIAFCWSGKKPSRTIVDAINGPLVSPSQLSIIPDNSKVITGPAAALMLFRTDMIWRLWLANGWSPNDFDFIVTLAGEEAEIGDALRARSEPCYEVGQWKIRCRAGGRYNLRN